MRHVAVLVMTMAVGAAAACSDDDGGDGAQTTAGSGGGGAAGRGGAAGTGGAAGAAGTAGTAGSNNGGTGGAPVPPTPALPPNAPTVTCPTEINGSLATSDPTQTGRHSRVAPIAACGMPKGSPGNAADPTNPHLYDVYRFANPTAAPVCFSLTLTYGAIGVGTDAGTDAGIDGGAVSPADAGSDSGVEVPVVNPEPAKYLTAYGTFYPTDITLDYLGDVGDVLTSPQAMGITVPAGETIDVVVYAIDNAPAGVGSYTLSCSTQ